MTRLHIEEPKIQVGSSENLLASSYNEFNDDNLNFGDEEIQEDDLVSEDKAIENDADQDSIMADESHAGLYRLNKNSKRWRSMYALRDSLRSLTSCVSTKTSQAQK
jgi:hypothetical protein